MLAVSYNHNSSINNCMLPTTDGEELSRQAIVLVEENLRLRVLLHAAISCEKSSDKSESPQQPRPQEKEKEKEEEEEGEGEEEEEGERVPEEQGGTGVNEEGSASQEGSASLPNERTVAEVEEEECLTATASSRDEEQEREVTDGGAEETGGKETGREEGEEGEKDEDMGTEEVRGSDGRGHENVNSSDSGENKDSQEGGEDTDRESVRRENNKPVEEGEMVATGDKERTATVDQSWPISSLLSDHTRSGPPRDHQVTAFGLPILSPTYIAEHCSTSGCDQQFFGPTILPPLTACVGVTETILSTRHPTSQHASTFTSGTSASRVTEISGTQLSTTSSSTYSFSAASSSSPGYFQQQSSLPPPVTTRQSIVQPWVGSSTSLCGPTAATRSSELAGPTRSSITAQQRSSIAMPSQNLNEHSHLPVQPHHEPTGVSIHSRISSVTHHANTRGTRYNSRSSHSTHPRASRTGSSRGHGHTPYYRDSSRQVSHNLSSGEVAPIGGFSTSSHSLIHTNLSCDSRGHPYCPGGVPSLPPSTASPFHGYTSGPSLTQPRQPPGFSASSVDPYYHCSTSTAAVYQHGTPHPQFTPHHPHHHQHSYTTLPPPPPPPPLPPHPLLPPPFPLPPHHQHPPSHQNAVWRPYSDRQQTSLTRFSLSDILSPSPAPLPSLGLPAAVSPPTIHQQTRISSFFVDHLLDDL